MSPKDAHVWLPALEAERRYLVESGLLDGDLNRTDLGAEFIAALMRVQIDNQFRAQPGKGEG